MRRSDGTGARWALLTAVSFGVGFYCTAAGVIFHIANLVGVGLGAFALCALVLLIAPTE